MGAAPPLPRDTAEANRVKHTGLRRRILYGAHDEDVSARIQSAVGNLRKSAWGPIDLTSNPYLHTWTQLAALYRQAPEVDPPAGGELAAAALAESGYWSLMQRVQRDTLGLREMLVRFDFRGEEVRARPVYPDLVECRANPFRPGEIEAVKEWLPDPADASKWVRVECDPAARIYRAIDEQGVDASRRVLDGNFCGEAYPWVSGGQPLLPYVVYHAAETGYLWDSWTGREVVEGTLQLAVFYSFYAHILRTAAWAQRYALGAEPVGPEISSDGHARSEIVTDPATVLILQSTLEQGGTPSVGQWNQVVDPAKVLESIRSYEQRLVEMAVGAADVTRTSSDIRSGYSLAVSREAVREAQRSFEPMFRRGDLAALRLVSRFLGVPDTGWRIRYSSIPRDPTELRAEWDRMALLIQAGLMDKATAYLELHPGLTLEEASTAVSRISSTNRLLAA
jgi:hypothetical protein